MQARLSFRSFTPIVTLLGCVLLSACGSDEPAPQPFAQNQPLVIPPALMAATRPSAAPARNSVAIDPNRSYDLASLIDLAQRSNPQTAAAWEQASQAASGVGLAQSQYLPQLSAQVLTGLQQTPLPIPQSVEPKGYFTASTREVLPTLALKWLLFDFGRRSAVETAARDNAFVANVMFTRANQQLVFAVSRAYYALAAARGRLAVAHQSLEAADVVADAVTMQNKNGLATSIDLARARAQAAQAGFALVQAQGDERNAYADLIASMGIASTATVTVADNTAQPLPESPAEVSQFVQQALASRPDIIAALGKVDASKANLAAAKAAYYPTVALVGQAYQNVGSVSVEGSSNYSVNKPGGNILLELDWPLFAGGARADQVAIARSAVSAAQDQLDAARDDAVAQVTDAYNALQTSLAENSAAQAAQTAAATAYAAALDAYQHGIGTYTDLADDEAALTQAESESETARSNAFSAAAALALATGALSTS